MKSATADYYRCGTKREGSEENQSGAGDPLLGVIMYIVFA